MERKDFREQYIADICGLLEDQEFVRRNTTVKAKNGFSRTRKLPFVFLIILIMQGLSRSIQRELNTFYQKVKSEDFSIQEVTKSAFSHARKKLKWEAFKELNQQGIESFYKNAPYLKWNGYRLLGIDGTTLKLPNTPSIEQDFGERAVRNNGIIANCMAQASMLYDLLNFTTLDAQIGAYGCGETNLLYNHFSCVNPGKDILIMDRGYAGVPLMYQLSMRKIDYVIRLKEHWWLSVKEMEEKGETDKILTFTLPKGAKELPDKYNTNIDYVRCRIIIITLPDGTKEVLCTSLMDDKISHKEFADLYHLRWNIEEGYKFYKSRSGIELFSGKSGHSIKQDFFAKVFMMTTMAVLAFPIEEKLKKEQLTISKKHTYKINRTNALSLVKEISVGLFIKKTVGKALRRFDQILRATMEIVRPNRKNRRKPLPKQPPSMNYKQL